MKKLLISILLLAAFLGCKKNEPGNLQYLKTITGGCFLEKSLSVKNSQALKTDTVTYSISNDSLNMFLGFNATCCGEFSNSSSIKGDSIIIEVKTTQIGLCNCICYYTYNFKFSGNANSYKYRVSFDDSRNFSGQIKP